ncbi:ribosome maturation factor RimP [Thermodesulfobacteriota bacterium]
MPAFLFLSKIDHGMGWESLANAASIIKQVVDLTEPILEEIGFELVDVEYLSKYGKWVLRIYIDKDGGVTIDDCARVSGELGYLVDIKDIIGHEYVLEVSSPGLNRPLKKETDFIRAIDKKIKVRMAAPINGRRNFSGYLKDFRDKHLFLEAEGGLINLPWPEVDKASLVYEFKN